MSITPSPRSNFHLVSHVSPVGADQNNFILQQDEDKHQDTSDKGVSCRGLWFDIPVVKPLRRILLEVKEMITLAYFFTLSFCLSHSTQCLLHSLSS